MSLGKKFFNFVVRQYMKAHYPPRKYYRRWAEQYCEENNRSGCTIQQVIKWAHDKGYIVCPSPTDVLKWFYDEMYREDQEEEEREKRERISDHYRSN